MKNTALLLIVISMTGCATWSKEEMEMAKLHYEAQKAQFNEQEQKPLITLKAKAGQSINLQGVEEFTVYAPETSDKRKIQVTQFQKQYHPAWGWVGKAAMVALPLWVQGKNQTDLVNAVGGIAGNNTTYTDSYNTTDSYNDSSQQYADSYNDSSIGQGMSGRMDSADDYSTGANNTGELRFESPDDYTHTPTVVEQPAPVIVDPTVVETNDNAIIVDTGTLVYPTNP